MDGGAWWAAVHGVAKSRARLSDFTFMHWRREWQPTPVFLPGESQGRGSLVGCRLWGRTESDTTEAMQQQGKHEVVKHWVEQALLTQGVTVRGGSRTALELPRPEGPAGCVWPRAHTACAAAQDRAWSGAHGAHTVGQKKGTYCEPERGENIQAISKVQSETLYFLVRRCSWGPLSCCQGRG